MKIKKPRIARKPVTPKIISEKSEITIKNIKNKKIGEDDSSNQLSIFNDFFGRFELVLELFDSKDSSFKIWFLCLLVDKFIHLYIPIIV